MKTTKILSVIVALISLVLMLASCEMFTPDQPGTNPPGGQNNGLKYNSIVYTDAEIDIAAIRLEMLDIVGQGIMVNHISTAPVSESEVVFGDSNRAITDAAKAALSAELEKSSKYDIGYIIYHDGKNIAVYWQHPDMMELAVADFLEECVIEKRLVLEEGTVTSSLFVKREFEEEKDWLKLESVAGEEVTKALKRLKDSYEPERLIGWLANLYDPEVGGFYYSRSARDNEPFLPDLESTHFVIGNVNRYGAIKYRDLPDDIKREVLTFVWSTQSKTDGYFYHPQWPQGRENLNTDRYGRDLSWATSLITNLSMDDDGDGILDKQYPLYCAPNGNKCREHDNTDRVCSFPITTSYYSSLVEGGVTSALSSSVGAAVSSVSSSFVGATASVSSRPDYSSRKAFSEWLEAYNSTIKVDSGRAHNLAALAGEIAAKGYSDVVLDHLDRVQKEVYDEQMKNGETPTGLWQRTVDYNAVYGLLKYTSFYNSEKYGRAINPEYYLHIARSCLEVITMDPEPGLQINDMYNMWCGVANLVSNIRGKTGGIFTSDERNAEIEKIYNLFRENASFLVDKSLEKINHFKMSDSSYTYNFDGTTQPKVYGVPVCLGGHEGDVNSVALACNMYEAIFRAFGYSMIPIYSAEDGQYFVDTIRNCSPIEKAPQSTGELKFDDSAYISKLTTKFFSEEAKTSGVKDDPIDPMNKAYYFASGDLSGTSNGDYISFIPVADGSNCYIFETDLYITSDSSDACLYQISLGDACMITLTKSSTGITVTVDPNARGTTGEESAKTKIDTDTWAKLRVECYIPEADSELDKPMIKIWINDELELVSDKYLGFNEGTPVKVGYKSVKFYVLLSPTAYIYLDNTFASCEDKVFDENDDSITDSRDNFNKS